MSNDVCIYYSKSSVTPFTETLREGFSRLGYGMQLRLIPDEYEQLSLDGLDEQHLNKLEALIADDLASEPIACMNRSRVAAISEMYEKAGIFCSNDSFITKVANDKLALFDLARSLGIPTPETQRLDIAVEDGLQAIGYPSVVKTRNGHGGTEVWWLDGKEDLDRFLADLGDESDLRRYVAQKAVDTLGLDMRIVVIDSKPWGAIRRHSDDSFKANVCLGAGYDILPYDELPKDVVAMCEKIIGDRTIALCGIDFMRDGGHWVFNEIEDPAWIRGLYETGHDVTEDICKAAVGRQ